MTRPGEFRNPLIYKHFSIALEGTNNTLYQMADLAPITDRQVVFDTELRENLGIPIIFDNWYELKSRWGVYNRLYQMTIISICSDIEFMLKDLFYLIDPDGIYPFGFFQRFNRVITALEGFGFNFSQVMEDLKNIHLGFQIRHISVHNMGYVDNKFKEEVNTEYQVNDQFVVTPEIYKCIFNSYGNFLKTLDENFITT